MHPIAELRQVTKTYHVNDVVVQALRGVSVQFQRGDFTVVVGPSGSGKSTLLHILGALDKPSHGDVVVAGQSLTHLTADERAAFRLAKLGFVFQDYNLIPVLTALENVEYVPLLQGTPAKQRRQRATELLSRVGLSSYLKRRPVHMSGGQQQRVAVARALASAPELVLADEPTANLDSQTGAELITLFRELNQEYQTTFVLASHDPMVIEKSPRVITLKDGLVQEDRRK